MLRGELIGANEIRGELPAAEQLFSILSMRSATVLASDVTAKARIRDTALWLFAQHGVAGTSLRAVAKEAGVSPGLVVHHFGGKDGLCRAVDEAVVQRIELALSEVPIEGSGADIVNARADMERLIALGVDGIITDYPDRLRAVMAGKDMPLPPQVKAR